MSPTNKNHYAIAIVGPRDMVSGFKALGVESYDADNAAEALEQLRTIKRQNNDLAAEKQMQLFVLSMMC